MEQTDDSIDKFINFLKGIENKKQTLDDVIEQICNNNLNKAYESADTIIQTEINQTKNLLDYIRQNLYKEENRKLNN